MRAGRLGIIQEVGYEATSFHAGRERGGGSWGAVGGLVGLPRRWRHWCTGTLLQGHHCTTMRRYRRHGGRDGLRPPTGAVMWGRVVGTDGDTTGLPWRWRHWCTGALLQVIGPRSNGGIIGTAGGVGYEAMPTRWGR
jgi:hypothetical protein